MTLRHPAELAADGLELVGHRLVPRVRVHLDRTGAAVPHQPSGNPGPSPESSARELALQRLAARDGWQARLIEPAATASAPPVFLTSWTDGVTVSVRHEPILDPAPLDALESVAEQRGSYAGVWDVIAWRDEQVLFITMFSGADDAVDRSRAAWLQAGLAAGFGPEDFLVAEPLTHPASTDVQAVPADSAAA